MYYLWILSLMQALRLTEPGALPLDTDPSTAQAIEDAGLASPLTARDVPVGQDPREFTMVLLTVQAWQESRFRPEATHDHGTGHGEWGVHQETVRGFARCSNAELHDPETGARCALELIHISFRICEHHPVEERMGWYAAGRTGCEKRLPLSRYRVGIVERLLREHPAYEGVRVD